MANPIVTGAMCTCTFGVAPGVLTVTTQFQTMSKVPVGTITEKLVTPFGVCSAIPPPAPPLPCTPIITSWIPACPTILVGGKPILTNSCKGVCAKGGIISFVSTPAMTVKTP